MGVVKSVTIVSQVIAVVVVVIAATAILVVMMAIMIILATFVKFIKNLNRYCCAVFLHWLTMGYFKQNVGRRMIF